ncbi:MAG: hypothetical protein C5B60_03505 [Chloroflexi bacterium]|nr:MAG: hypothetical protein C5B60_03505 [Chloroflexota bacterium]
MAEDFFSDLAPPKDDFFGDLGPAPAAAPEGGAPPRGLGTRIWEGLKGGFGEEPLGMSPETQRRFPMWAPFQPLVAGADVLYRAPGALAGAAAGYGAGMLEENPEAAYPLPRTHIPGTDIPLTGLTRAEADRLQRDLTIMGQGAMIEPAMGEAAALHPAVPAEQAVAREARAPPPTRDIITGEPIEGVPESTAPTVETPPAKPEAPPAAPAPAQPEAPPAGPSLLDYIVTPAEAMPRVPRLPEVPREVPREAPPPEPAPPEAARAAPERVPEEVAPPPAEGRAYEPELDFFSDLREPEPPARVTERIPEVEEPGRKPAAAVSPPPEPPEPPRAREPAAARPAKRPQSLIEYIRQQGGIDPKDKMIGDVRGALGPMGKGLIRKGGKPLDKLLTDAINERFIDDPGYWAEGERSTTPADLIDALARDDEARAAKDDTGRVYRQGQEVTARAPTEYATGVQGQSERIMDALAKAGVRGEGIDTEALYDAAQSMYRGEVRNPLDAYDQASARIAERDYAQRTGMRPGGEEVPPAGEPGARPGVEEALPAPRAEPPGARPAGEPARAAAEETGVEGRPQLVLPGAEQRPGEMLQRRAAAPLRPTAEQQPMETGLFGEPGKQRDLLLRQQALARGISGRPIRTRPLPLGTEQAILERGYERAIGPPGELREPYIEAALRDAGVEPKRARAVAKRPGVFRKAIRAYQETFQPELIGGDDTLRADAAVREFKSARAQQRDEIVREGRKRERAWAKIPEADKLEFLGQVEQGLPVKPQFRAAAQRYRTMLDKAYELEQRWGSKAGYIENYFPHIWERPAGDKPPVEQYFARTLGPNWFERKRVFDLIQEGRDAGYTLRSTNPETLIRMRLLAGADMRMGMQLLDRLKEMGLARPVREISDARAVARSGWAAVNAPNREQWLIHPDVMPLWRNGVEAKGLWSNQGLTGDAFRAWMGLKNAWVPLKLALSAFHLLHVAHLNAMHHWARGAHELFADVPRHLVQGQVGKAAGDLGKAVGSVVKGISPYQKAGIEGRRAWVMADEARTPEGREAVKLMNEGGFSPMMSEQLRIDAGQKFRDAAANWSPHGMAYHGARRIMQAAQSWLFEHWIPHLKTAAYLDNAARWLRNHPEMQDDAINRRVGLAAIAKSVDNRFGEMFYDTLFWNRTLKDIGIATHLSLGWNLGFLREFGGAALEAVTRPASVFKSSGEARQVARSATDKITYASMYMGMSLLIGGMMTKMLSGGNPDSLWDYIFPRVGGVNPDGSPRRVTTMFYTREIPMALKHIQEQGGGLSGAASGLLDMWYNKLLVGPMIEFARNKNYFGQEIRDPTAPGYVQAEQLLRHIWSQQMSPMSMSGAQRARETGGGPGEEALSYLGFGPAPKYAERTAAQNRIAALYRQYVAPEVRPYEEEAVGHAKRAAASKVLMALQRGNVDEIQTARQEAIKSGLSSRYVNELGRISSDQRMFRQLSSQAPNAAISVLEGASPEERKRYWPYTATKTKMLWTQRHPQEQPFAAGTQPAT